MRYNEGHVRRLEQPYATQPPERLAAHLVWRYVSDVLEGGHLQFFAGGGEARLQETFDALRSFEANCYMPVLRGAAQVWAARRRGDLRTLPAMLQAVAQNEFAPHDEQFHRCIPSWQTCLDRCLDSCRGGTADQDWPELDCKDGKAVMRSLAAP